MLEMLSWVKLLKDYKMRGANWGDFYLVVNLGQGGSITIELPRLVLYNIKLIKILKQQDDSWLFFATFEKTT